MTMGNRRAYSRRIATVRPDNGLAHPIDIFIQQLQKEILAEGGFVL
jgi:hypothetical protein